MGLTGAVTGVQVVAHGPDLPGTPIVGGRWAKGTTYPCDLQVVHNSLCPDIPTQGEIQPIKY